MREVVEKIFFKDFEVFKYSYKNFLLLKKN